MNLTELSRALGYSVSVVSRALNPSPDKSCTVSPKTRAKIRQAATHYNYTHNHAAACVRRGKNPAIGVFMPTFCRSLICDALQGMSQVAAEKNLSMNLYFGGSQDLAHFLRQATRLANVGIIVYDTESNKDPGDFARLLKDFCLKGGKVVLFNTMPPDDRFRNELDSGQMAVIKFDEYDGGRQAAAYLHSLHCARNLVVSFISNYYRERAQGFCDWFQEQNLPCHREDLLIPSCDISVDRDSLRQTLLKHLGHLPLGLFIPSDYQMLDMLSIITNLNLQLGKDIHLIAYDKCDFLDHINQNLASMEQNFHHAGQRAMQMITLMLNREPVTSELIKTSVATFSTNNSCFNQESHHEQTPLHSH